MKHHQPIMNPHKMSKTIQLSGMCATKYKDDDHIHYYLVQPDGYKIDLVDRVSEIADFMGGKMAVVMS